MRRLLLITLLITVPLATGCIIYFVDQPSTAKVGSTIKIEMVLEADSAPLGAQTPIACIGLPESWGTVMSVTFEASLHGTTALAGTGVPAPTQAGLMNAGYSFSTNGELAAWQCYAGANTDYGSDSYGTATFQVRVGSSGMFTLRYSAGSVSQDPDLSIAAKSLGVSTPPDDLDVWYISSVGPDPELGVYRVAYGAGSFIAAGVDAGASANVTLSSPNGKNWSLTVLDPVFDLTDLVYGSGRFVMLGDNGEVFLSSDGSSWAETASLPASINAAAYGSDQFVAVGYGGLAAVSVDGAVWATTQASPTTTDSFYGIGYGDGKFSAVGFNYDTGNALSYASTNGTDWTGTPLTSIHDPLWDVAYGNGRFVAVGGNGLIIWSPNGYGSWSIVTPVSSDQLTGIAYGNGHFVAVGDNGTILTSADGMDWKERTSGTGVILYDVKAGEGGFVAVGANSVIIRQGLATGSGGGGGGGGCAAIGNPPSGPAWPGLLAVTLITMVLVGMRKYSIKC